MSHLKVDLFTNQSRSSISIYRDTKAEGKLSRTGRQRGAVAEARGWRGKHVEDLLAGFHQALQHAFSSSVNEAVPKPTK